MSTARSAIIESIRKPHHHNQGEDGHRYYDSDMLPMTKWRNRVKTEGSISSTNAVIATSPDYIPR